MSDDICTRRRQYRQNIDAVQHRRTRGQHYSQVYHWDKVIFDFDPDEVFPSQATAVLDNNALYYKWPDEPPIRVTEMTVRKKNGTDEQRSEKQAYHCLSMLDAEGHVLGWREA